MKLKWNGQMDKNLCHRCRSLNWMGNWKGEERNEVGKGEERDIRRIPTRKEESRNYLQMMKSRDFWEYSIEFSVGKLVSMEVSTEYRK